jgi:hypothetical protein
MQNEFGREASELSRIEKEIKSFMTTNYRRFVVLINLETTPPPP